MRICFDYGHGGRDPGACYLGRKESDDVLSMGKEIANYLRSRGAIVDETRTKDEWVSLHQRTQFANKNTYDYFISFHRNAFRPEVATGAETFVYHKGSQKAHSLATRIQEALGQIGFRNRGVKRGDFYVLRNTKAPALLIEIGFIDNTADNKVVNEKRSQIITALGDVILGEIGD